MDGFGHSVSVEPSTGRDESYSHPLFLRRRHRIQPNAPGVMRWLYLIRRGYRHMTLRNRETAAARERTPRRQVGELRHCARDRCKFAAFLRAQPRPRSEKPQRVRMDSMLEHTRRRPAFDDAAAVHHQHALHVLRYHAEIV